MAEARGSQVQGQPRLHRKTLWKRKSLSSVLTTHIYPDPSLKSHNKEALLLVRKQMHTGKIHLLSSPSVSIVTFYILVSALNFSPKWHQGCPSSQNLKHNSKRQSYLSSIEHSFQDPQWIKKT
jgi:hypothetical protein